MRHFLLLLFLLGVAQAHADSTATNATELRDALRGTAQPAELRELGHDNGCGPNGCLVDIEPLRIWLEQGRMEQLDGTPLRLRELGSNLPELDLSPLGAYRVSTGGKTWGMCLEFSHSGIGKSGVHQRWSSLVLVPFKNAKPGPNAYRIVGYWTGCDSLQVGSQPGQVLLPVVSQQPEHGLQALNYHCSAQRCTAQPANIQVSGEPAAEVGILQLHTQAR